MTLVGDIAKLSVVGIGMRTHSGVARKIVCRLGGYKGEYPDNKYIGDQDFSRDR